MDKQTPALLPEYIADVLPEKARQIERARRQLLDLYQSYGYELVMPPLLENLDSLLAGVGVDLTLRTFQCVDQLSGKMLGIRADITPQVARIDSLKRHGDDESVSRFCYCGPVLHTRPQGLFSTREPILIGTELFGYAGVEADLETIDLLIQALLSLGVPTPIRIDLGHAGILPALLEALAAEETWAEPVDLEVLRSLLAAKDLPGLQVYLGKAPLSWRRALEQLAFCFGPIDRRDPDASVDVMFGRIPPLRQDHQEIVSGIRRICGSPVWRDVSSVELSLDLADLQEHHRYHSGMVFAVYLPGWPTAIARGGRYVVGQGRRPATGASIELGATLSSLGSVQTSGRKILAPLRLQPALEREIKSLRMAGEVVLQALPGQAHLDCTHEFVFQSGCWCVVPRALPSRE